MRINGARPETSTFVMAATIRLNFFPDENKLDQEKT
jgi:hypothetical protein